MVQHARLAACLLLLASPALAEPPAAGSAQEDLINPDRPGIADGSMVVGTGRFQAEAGLQYEYYSTAQGHLQLVFLPTLLRFGLSDAWELRIEGNSYTWQQTNEDGQQSRTDGFSPASIGAKYHFIDDGGFDRPSVGAILRIFPPAGSGAFHTHRFTGDFRLTADWNFSSEWSLNPNIGIARIEDINQHTATPGLFAMTLNYNPSPILNFFADTGMQSAETHHGRASVIVDAGTAYIVGRDIQLDASVGWGAAGVTTPRPFVAVGVSKRF